MLDEATAPLLLSELTGTVISAIQKSGGWFLDVFFF